MKRLRKKSGFTLVECVVAMAILAVMSLLLAMMLQITIDLRNHNRAIEDEVDGQVENLVDADGAVATESIDGADIDFGNDVVINGDKANKVYFDNAENVQLGALDYGIKPAFGAKPPVDPDEDTETPDGEEPPVDNSGRKVYGADVTSSVMIQEDSSTLDPATNLYIKKWKITFDANGCSDVKSIKIAFPDRAKLISAENIINCDIHNLGNRVVGVKPKNDGAVSVLVEFTISPDDYVYYEETDTEYTNPIPENFKHYFTGSGSGANTVTFTRNVSTGDFNAN